jgi:hypothetical protein
VRSQAKAPSAGLTQRQANGRPAGSRLSFAVLAALALCALVAFTASVASGAERTEFVKSFGPDGTVATNFEQISGVAVDQQTGAVYVLDGEAGVLHKFDAKGQPLDFAGTAPYISGNEVSGLTPNINHVNEAQVAVDSTSHIVYVTEKESVRAFQQDGEPAEFSAGPGVDTSEIPGFGTLTGVAVDANGSVYASDRNAGTVRVYAATGEPLTSFAAPDPGNLAVNHGGTVYVANNKTPSEGGGVYSFIPDVFPVTASTTYTEAPQLDTGEGFAVGVGVDPLTGDIYVSKWASGGVWVAVYDETGTLLKFIGKPEEDGEFQGIIQGLGVVGGGEEFQLYAGDWGTSQVRIFGEVINPGPPSIESTSVSEVTSNSATLKAEINPNTFATTYRFEYGPSDCSVTACTTVPLAGAQIGAGHRPVAVSQDIAGLQPGTTYHYRVVAENSQGTTEGSDRTFTTQVSGLGFQLADRRAWEMVSPSNKHGARLIGTSEGQIQAAADGNALAYLGLGSVEPNPEGMRTLEPSTALARRGTEGWRSEDITTPNDSAAPLLVGNQNEYKLFADDLSKALVEPRGTMLLSPQASERTPYLRQNTDPATYMPLLSGKEGFANVPPGTEFGGNPDLATSFVFVRGATPGLSHVVLSSPYPLVAGVDGRGLYEWTGGQLQAVSLLPADEDGTFVDADYIGSGLRSIRHAISDDGSRVFWTAFETQRLYLRDMDAGETVRLDVVQPGGSGSGGQFEKPIFQGASADGRVAFFTDGQQLTEGASPSGADLYRCEIPLEDLSQGCVLTNISAPIPGSGESAEVPGLVSALSDDGTKVYFVAKGVLDTAPGSAGESAVPGEPNLYLWQEGEGIRFIVTLSEEDHRDWGSGGKEFSLSSASSPSGRYFSFMSERSLTGYDNRDAVSGEPAEEVFRYDAVSDRLDCVSCNPSGANPIGLFAGVGFGESLVDPRGLWEDRRLAAVLPQTTVTSVAGLSLYRPRIVLDNGRVFFNAADSLVPADSNGEWDVYQHEPTGVGDCSASSGGTAISRSAGGCVSLISSGTAEEETGFLDASAAGDDVFFLTSAKLSVLDEDDERDIYDARVDGVVARLLPDTECLGEACQPAALVPNDPTPASAGFKGQGNPQLGARRRCAKGKRLVRRNGRARCVARKQKRQERASKRRRAGR